MTALKRGCSIKFNFDSVCQFFENEFFFEMSSESEKVINFYH